jgi:DNA-binding NtrC family response regulator
MANQTDTFTLLLVDDDPRTLSGLKRLFRKDGYRLVTAGSGHAALALMDSAPINAALIDFQMPGMDGLELLKCLLQRDPQMQVIMLTGQGKIETAVAAMKEGAADFLEKPFQPEALRARTRQLVQIWRLRSENRRLKTRGYQPSGFHQLIGKAQAMQTVKQTITRAALADATTLIYGETGTGKELVARAIHHHSPRSTQSFVPVDCSAISENLVESELFGHVKGAFTGAHRSVMGLIRSANGGTLFLDEIGELPLSTQAKLLRTLQEKAVRPVGSDRTVAVDIRIVGATHRDLAAEVQAGRFREDLFYRLSVVPITLPPLRERAEDIPLLAAHFAAKFSAGFAAPKPIRDDAMACLMAYHWPGNVRELENAIRRALALGQDETITPEDLPETITGNAAAPSPSPASPLDDSLAAYEKTAVHNALCKSGGNRKAAARILGVGEATLYRKLKAYQLR